MAKSISQPPPVIVQKTYEFVLWLLPKVESFPRGYRFTVGERLSAKALDLLNTVVEAAYSRNKAVLLEAANRSVNSIRYLLRLAKDLKLMTIDSYGVCANINEVWPHGKGWPRGIHP